MAPRRPLPPDVVRMDRTTFFTQYWDYADGDHVTVLAPTGGGKSWLSFQLLQHTASPERKAVVMVMKPRDTTVTQFTAAMKLKVVRDWPPSRIGGRVARFLGVRDTSPGWVLWPRETNDPARDDIVHRAVFQRALRERYRSARKTPNIVFADETYSLEHELKLETDLRRIWTKGRSVGCGLFAASQRPVWISRWALQAQHLFLGYDPDRDMQRRYGEIGGGIDPDVIRDVVASLGQYEFLYCQREKRGMCIITAQ